MVNGVETIKCIRNEIIGCQNIVCSPIIFSSDNTRLMDNDSVNAYRHYLLPITKLLVMKSHEAEIILGMKITTDAEMADAAKQLHEEGVEFVLLRGSCHTEGRVTALLMQTEKNISSHLIIFTDGSDMVLLVVLRWH